jgi:hypothetical protein
MAFAIIGVIVLALSFISQNGFYVAILGVAMIVLGFVFFVVLGTLKDAKAKSVLIR